MVAVVALVHSERKAPAVALQDLVVAYDRHPAVHHLSGVFPAAGLTAIVGPNGGGKSTLLKALAGMQPISSGRLDLGGLRRRDIAFLPQHSEIDRSIPITVLDLVCCGFVQRAGLFGGIGRAMRAEAQAALELVGLAGFENRLIDSMSIGQFQRALFARVLVQDAAMILLDEPFAAIDSATTADLVGLVGRWHDEGRSVVLVSHDIDLVRRACPETLLLAREPIAWGRTAEVLTPGNLARARRRSEAWDESAGACELSDGGHGDA